MKQLYLLSFVFCVLCFELAGLLRRTAVRLYLPPKKVSCSGFLVPGFRLVWFRCLPCRNWLISFEF